MISNNWTNTIVQLSPDYLEILKKWEGVLENGPKILTEIKHDGKDWNLKVYSHNEFEYFDPTWFSEELYNRLTWCEQKLSNWKNVQRKCYDIWAFENKEDAEKFQTLYTLTWIR